MTRAEKPMEWDAVVIGAGPAGLMAADVISAAGRRVLVLEAKPSVARKFLMAGKSGLNLTKDEPLCDLLSHFGTAQDWLAPMLRAFDAEAVQSWARGLGQELFTGSTGRVFPKVMKASPMLRNWVVRLQRQGVEIRTRWYWNGWDGDALRFLTPDGEQLISARATVLALGGASWARLGSDGAWADILRDRAVECAEFAPANAALSLRWSDHMQPHFGAALKSVRWQAGDLSSRGEAILSARGLEGGGLYSLTPALRQGATFHVDLMPDVTLDAVRARLPKSLQKARLSPWLKKTLRLPPAKVALFNEMTVGQKLTPEDWPALVKRLPIKGWDIRPLDEAISTAGGVCQSAVTDDLMLAALPGTFCAGEMLDWEAPTGGYLLTGCFATGRCAGAGVLRYLSSGKTR